MTRITYTPACKDEYGFARLSVNGRYLGVPERITRIEKTKPGRFEGVANGYPFIIEGGKESGGGPKDWMFKWPPLTGDKFDLTIYSAKEAIVLIENS